ncbi:type-2 ice-structuring protein-like isoform X1 [Xyrichtys novacula]|uniref:Type-2 ice-structuring protein-like isoform X1 n=1 Tax=Xyrichtys novacula TaxID=13765 RepID=A0AAV1EWS6_XYRNO|nr:type-2 ice-structuring protein-like isoform X1 [Xyrichtys novacula]
MKLLTVSALLCGLFALTAAVEELEDVVKRTSPPFCTESSKLQQRVFIFVDKKLTWAEAESNCVSMGGHLASVHSLATHNLVRRLIKRRANRNSNAWIGGSDQSWESVWQWTDGTCFHYNKWLTGQPNNSGNQDCLQISLNGWEDRRCSCRQPSVCALVLFYPLVR